MLFVSHRDHEKSQRRSFIHSTTFYLLSWFVFHFLSSNDALMKIKRPCFPFSQLTNAMYPRALPQPPQPPSSLLPLSIDVIFRFSFKERGKRRSNSTEGREEVYLTPIGSLVPRFPLFLLFLTPRGFSLASPVLPFLGSGPGGDRRGR